MEGATSIVDIVGQFHDCCVDLQVVKLADQSSESAHVLHSKVAGKAAQAVEFVRNARKVGNFDGECLKILFYAFFRKRHFMSFSMPALCVTP